MIERVISGGQRGADQAGLRVARDCGIPTGGWMPLGYLTLDGPDPELAKIYNMSEHKSPTYAPRTYANVKDSEGTIRCAYDFFSAGEKCTMKAIKQYQRPFFDIDLSGLPEDEEVIEWIINNNLKVLNIAGNAGRTTKQTMDIFRTTCKYLKGIFRAVQKETEL